MTSWASSLPHFNAHFGVPATQAGSAYRVPDAFLDIAGVLCHKERRRVAKDNDSRSRVRTSGGEYHACVELRSTLFRR